MKQFPTIQKLDSAILYGMELASSISIVLLSIGVVASMSNTLTDGWLLSSSIVISRTWIISQTIAMDTGLIVSIVRAFVLVKDRHYIQCSLYTVLSILLLSTTAIVSNIESIQQTLGITLEKAYTYSPIPLPWLVSMRSLCVVLLIVAHALKYVQTEEPAQDLNRMPASVENRQEELNQPEPAQDVHIIEEKEQEPKALPAPKKERTRKDGNLERVRVYLLDHPEATARQIATALSLSPGIANKWRQCVQSPEGKEISHE